jgi:uncharacterized membrane-anchored protein YhcB (DUF1043 family)
MSAFVLIGAGALLLLAGVGLGFWLGTIGRKQEAEKVSDLQQELDDYRRNVTDHFNVTAEKFQTIGKEYRKLYEHMASGAASLCHPEQSGTSLEFPSVELIGRDRQAVEVEAAEAIDAAPVDFEITESATADEADLAAEAEPVETTGVEPSDEELLETESTEELLADHELARGETDAGKTYH